MQHQDQLRMGISSIIYDLKQWDYRVGHSGLNSLDITLERDGEEIADVSFSDEEMRIFRKRELSTLEEQELQLYLDDLLWEDDFENFSHLGTMQVEYHNGHEVARMLEEKYKDDLLYIRYNEDMDFMGYLEEASIKRIDGSDTLVCYFNPIDDESELIRTTVLLKSDVKAVATANAVKAEGGGDVLELSRHVEHLH
ncbi:hypothetical protein [Ammoniphilus sp. YIM 78166]|uniref:hypothetical protein n=1 Tax=Ammoniphilus sp. YIM 78166 TaxID=1644106 RepID=UPI00106F799B|nr:hypothetical protein [Ammoniphilus sp. YIM 78166]